MPSCEVLPGPVPPGVDELVANTRRKLVRLRAMVKGLDDRALATVPASGWGVSATLAHLAFYDDWVAERWRRYLSAGHFDTLPDDITDLTNAAGSRGWQAMAAHRAQREALEAAESVAILIGQLPRSALEAAAASGRDALVDRSLHWDPHLDEIAVLADVKT